MSLGFQDGITLKIQGQIYPILLFSQEFVVEIRKNFFPGKNVIKKNTLSQKIVIPTLVYPRVAISLKFRVNFYPRVLFS